MEDCSRLEQGFSRGVDYSPGQEKPSYSTPRYLAAMRTGSLKGGSSAMYLELSFRMRAILSGVAPAKRSLGKSVACHGGGSDDATTARVSLGGYPSPPCESTSAARSALLLEPASKNRTTSSAAITTRTCSGTLWTSS